MSEVGTDTVELHHRRMSGGMTGTQSAPCHGRVRVTVTADTTLGRLSATPCLLLPLPVSGMNLAQPLVPGL